MYPRVKVRVEEFKEQEECLSPQTQQEKENQSSVSPLLPIARILKDYVLNSTMDLNNSASKVEQKRGVVKESKPNLKASLVSRPRAVLSSPDNDGLIGSRNKLVNERSSTPKMHKKVTTAVARIRTIPIEEVKKPNWALKTCSDNKGFKNQNQNQNQNQKQKQKKVQEQEPVLRTSQKKKILKRVAKPNQA
ncbi:hypothetical protein G4B88_024623 [Cannabis sativa]|uniref:Uncharacterized protein n=1 Tax=Cannabis sativa TaxID=3483 RepID=A0A7J6GW73_CANSA|nr:hypothetical protein G4B88_024623 [Cannabis sativa]